MYIRNERAAINNELNFTQELPYVLAKQCGNYGQYSVGLNYCKDISKGSWCGKRMETERTEIMKKEMFIVLNEFLKKHKLINLQAINNYFKKHGHETTTDTQSDYTIRLETLKNIYFVSFVNTGLFNIKISCYEKELFDKYNREADKGICILKCRLGKDGSFFYKEDFRLPNFNYIKISTNVNEIFYKKCSYLDNSHFLIDNYVVTLHEFANIIYASKCKVLASKEPCIRP